MMTSKSLCYRRHLTNVNWLFYNSVITMDKKLVALIMLFFITFALFVGALIFKDPLISLTRAKEGYTPSPVRSMILAWPIRAVVADGISESVINVFVISQSNRPLADKVVTLTNSLGSLDKKIVKTDNNGKATFKISSNTPGVAEIEATVEPNIKMANKISINFE